MQPDVSFINTWLSSVLCFHGKKLAFELYVLRTLKKFTLPTSPHCIGTSDTFNHGNATVIHRVIQEDCELLGEYSDC